MVSVHRFAANPILSPNKKHPWESEAAFNGCPIVAGDGVHLLYRAMGAPVTIDKTSLELSVIGHALSFDRIHFVDRKALITPQHPWEKFGCEDPRVTKIDDTYYIFYTGISTWPPSPQGIKVAVATTKDFKTIDQKHLVTPFNAKAMTLFPDRINGKLTALLTVNCDLPPSTIAIAQFDTPEQMWDEKYWKSWFPHVSDHAVPLLRSRADHVEIGAPPIKTDDGWLLLYCYIFNYQSGTKLFTIEAALLDAADPRIIKSHTKSPLLFPEPDYELIGKIPNVIFPSGALVFNNNIGIYYGAADTTVCLATCSMSQILTELKTP